MRASRGPSTPSAPPNVHAWLHAAAARSRFLRARVESVADAIVVFVVFGAAIIIANLIEVFRLTRTLILDVEQSVVVVIGIFAAVFVFKAVVVFGFTRARRWVSNIESSDSRASDQPPERGAITAQYARAPLHERSDRTKIIEQSKPHLRRGRPPILKGLLGRNREIEAQIDFQRQSILREL